MKSGTGDDPFADEDPEESTEEAADDESADEPSFDIGETDAPSSTSRTSETEAASSTTSATSDEYSLPYYQRRSSVKEDRDDVLQFFVREDTAQGEDELERAVADELDIRPKELYKLDLREAALLVAMEHPEEVAEKLREWGYEHV